MYSKDKQSSIKSLKRLATLYLKNTWKLPSFFRLLKNISPLKAHFHTQATNRTRTLQTHLERQNRFAYVRANEYTWIWTWRLSWIV